MTHEQQRALFQPPDSHGPSPETVNAAPAGVEVALDGFWSKRDYLQHIYRHAQATMVAPTALLALTLARVAAEIGPQVQLPAVVGGNGSLNLYVGLVGPSAGGKSSAFASSKSLSDWRQSPSQLGSGEGLLAYFVRREKDPTTGEWCNVQHKFNMLAVVDEVDQLTALSSRSGATLMATLRTAWGGGELGFGYADDAKRRSLDDHSYRLSLVVGIQPGRARPLLEDTDGGTPQRFIWASLVDKDAPEVTPEPPGKMPWNLHPKIATGQSHTMGFDTSIIDEIREDRRKVLRGESDGVDGHRNYAKMKIAAILALMDQRLHVVEMDWKLAGHIMEVSRRTRSSVEAELQAELAVEGLKRAKAVAFTAVLSEEELRRKTRERVLGIVANHVSQHGGAEGCLRGCIRDSIPSRDRRSVDLDDVLGTAVAEGTILQSTRAHRKKKGEQVLIYLSPGTTESP